MTEEELLRLNKQGLIPGPKEDEKAFKERVEQSLHLRKGLEKRLQDAIGFSAKDCSDQPLMQSAYALSRRVFDMAPTWIPVFFSNYRLAPWHGGCAWIFQLEKTSPPLALLQLRGKLFTKSKYLGFYDRDELIAHECSHVGRASFEEPIFEEFFAYRTAHSAFRRLCGPLLRSPLEALVLVGLLFLVLLVDFFALSLYGISAYLTNLWWKLLPALYLTYLLLRLGLRASQLQKCLYRLTELLGQKEKAFYVSYRLKDQEIVRFAKSSPEQILAYGKKQARDSLRWQMILAAYFSQEKSIPKNRP